MKRKWTKKLEKLMMKSKLGIILWILVGIFVLAVLLKTANPTLYFLVIVGTPFLFYARSQDWLPYIYGGIVLALGLQLVLGLILSTRLPVVAIVSNSMEHGAASSYPCGKMMNNYVENFDNWWMLCSYTYEDFGITKEDFVNFPFKDGMKAGDMAIVQGSTEYRVGDVIVYQAGQEAPIIHRIVAVNEDGSYQTKGDHNPGQNYYERYVTKSQVEGKVIFVIPKLGFIKLLFTQIFGV
jgi:hypothetical protein